VLCPVRRPVTTLDCVLLKDSNLVFVVGLRPTINSRACLLSTTRTTPHCQMLIIHPAFNLMSHILPRDPQGQLRSYKLLSRTASGELVSDFVSWYVSMSRDPVQPHSVPSRGVLCDHIYIYYYYCCCRRRRCFILLLL
jgi:hypothetical protein